MNIIRNILMSLILSVMVFFMTTLVITQCNSRPVKEKEIKNVQLIDYKSVLLEEIDKAPASIQIHHYILKYSKKYDVPVELSYNVIRMETGFRGPLHFSYNPHQISSANAYGSMQILLSTARWFMDNNKITKEDLLYNTDLNVEIGIKYLSYLYDRKDDWRLALGYYNTGYWKINSYAIEGVEGLDNI